MKLRILLDDGATWPDPRDLSDVADRLVHGQPSRDDLLAAAAVIATYQDILLRSGGNESVIVQIRCARHAFKVHR
jgi:hypothetical protein